MNLIEIKKAMVAVGMTQIELAKTAGIAESTVSRVLSGKRKPNNRTMSKICAALGMGYLDICDPGTEKKERLSSKRIISILQISYEDDACAARYSGFPCKNFMDTPYGLAAIRIQELEDELAAYQGRSII